MYDHGDIVNLLISSYFQMLFDDLKPYSVISVITKRF